MQHALVEYCATKGNHFSGMEKSKPITSQTLKHITCHKREKNEMGQKARENTAGKRGKP